MNNLITYLIVLLTTLLSLSGYSQEVTKALTFTGNKDYPIFSRYNSVIKDTDGGYYIEVSISLCDTLYLGDHVIACEQFPQEELNKQSKRIYIVKVTPELEIDTFIRVMGFSNVGDGKLKFTVNDDFLFMSYRTAGDKYSMFGDSLFYHDSLDNGGVLKFDKRFNFIDRPIRSNKAIDKIVCNDSLLIYLSHFGGDDPISYGDRKYHREYEVFNGDTLWTNYKYSNSLDSFYAVNRSPFAAVYNIDKDSITHYWKFIDFPSSSEAYAFTLDDKGKLWTTTFGVVEEAPNPYDNIFHNMLGFNLQGERTDLVPLGLTKYNTLLTDKDGSKLGVTYFSHDYKVMFGDTIYNNYDLEGVDNSTMMLLVKFDDESEVEWIYYPSANGGSKLLSSFDVGEKYITSHWRFYDVELTLNDQFFPRQEEAETLIKIDKETGKELSHVYGILSPDKHSSVYYIESVSDESDKVRILAFLKYDATVLGLADDIELNNGLIFMEGKLSFLSSVLEPAKVGYDFNILGNPIINGGQLRIQNLGEGKLSYEIYNMNGEKVSVQRNESRPKEIIEIDVSGLGSAAYVVKATSDKNEFLSKIFVVQ